jgi:DNA-binding NarL/FixJ family response regulator
LAATGATPALQEAYEIARDCAADGLRAELAAELDRRGAAVRPGTSAALAGIERRIVSMLLEGAGFRDIAQRMLVTPTLVRRTVEALCARMGVRSHEELRTVTAVL